MESSRFNVLHSRSDNSEVIVCRGVLDHETCGELQAIIERALEDRVQRLRLDFADLVTIDESGLRCLHTTSKRCRESGVLFEVHANEALIPSTASFEANRRDPSPVIVT